ncbi:MAG: hypothetical protein AB7K52_13685 [Phycisphaerales bacterium]
MQRHEWWRAIYRERRYLEHLSAADLVQRLRDVMNNMVNITPEAKLGFHKVDPVGEAWWIRFTHVLEEYSLRGQGLPYDVMREHQLPDVIWPKRGKLARSGKPGWQHILPTLPEGAVVKYGKLEFLRPMLEHGQIRLCPASFYKDTSLGPHRHDDERVRTTHQHPFGTKIRVVQRADGTSVPNGPESPVLGNITTRVESWDYFVWCGSGALEPRLFIDFDHADACVIVRDVRAFAQRLGWAASQHILGAIPSVGAIEVEWKGVRYFDPHLPPKPPNDRLPVPWSKPLRYAYQQEYRIVIEVFPSPASTLPVLNLCLGPLSDIAELVYVGEMEGHTHVGRGSLVPRGK